MRKGFIYVGFGRQDLGLVGIGGELGVKAGFEGGGDEGEEAVVGRPDDLGAAVDRRLQLDVGPVDSRHGDSICEIRERRGERKRVGF